jgi:hypothetical protein
MPERMSTSPGALLNASESRLVEASRGTALKNASAGELKRYIARARALRDKWRDVYEEQRRGTQKARTSRATTANRRSREKSEVFAEALARLEGRLEKLHAAGETAAGGRSAAGKPRSTRARQHRQERSRTRRTLADHVAERESAEAWSARASLPPMQTRRSVKKKTAKGKKKTGARGKNAEAHRTAARSKVNPRDQSRSPTARQRVRTSSPASRIRGHVTGRNKRVQARRDRR